MIAPLLGLYYETYFSNQIDFTVLERCRDKLDYPPADNFELSFPD